MHRLVLSRRNVPRSQRGIALIMVLSLVALVATVISEFQYNSHVSYQLAINARDGLQAEYNALSALRLRALLLKQSKKIEMVLKNPMLSQLMGGDEGGGSLSVAPILEMIPVECGLLSAIIKQTDSELGRDSSGSPADFFDGECMATSVSEHSKISLNTLAKKYNNSSRNITHFLIGLLSDPSLEKHFQEDDRNGTHAESPEEFVGAIVDWIDPDDNEAANSVSDEDRFYTYLKDSYKVKNAPFDSLQELQLVHGMDDELYSLLKGHLSIYTQGTQIELSTAPLERIVFLGLPALLRDGMIPEQLWSSPQFPVFLEQLVEMKQMAMMGMNLLTVRTLKTLVSSLEPFVDSGKVNEVFTDKSSTTWYTIEAEGRVGNASRRLKGVFQASEGKFYYMRVE